MKKSTFSPISSRHRVLSARWGLLIVAAILACVLVVSSFSGYLSARESYSALVRAAAGPISHNIRRELWRSADNPGAALGLVLEDLRDQGVRYIAVVDGSNKVLLEVGEAEGQAQAIPSIDLWGPEPVALDVVGAERVRVLSLLRPGPGRHRQRDRPRATLLGRGRELDDARLLVELEPVVAHELLTQAQTTLALSVIAAFVLFAVGSVFWRLSRRADLIEAQLAQDRQLKALGQMSAVLGHELRNPLAALKGHAQLLLERLPVDHIGYAGAQTVVREAQRIERLTSQILDFARTGSVERRACDPRDVLCAAIERADVEPVELKMGDVPSLWSLDRARVEQVLVNLLLNARQASAADVPVEVCLEHHKSILQIRVRDHGAGILPGDEELIFEPFFTRRVKGTGLGLALARRIIESHGGQLRASNHSDGGAVFFIDLPSEE